MKSYEKIIDCIVPRSSKLVYEDGDYGLFNVTMFRKVVDEFKTVAREAKFFVREFEYDTSTKDEQDRRTTELKADVQKKYNALVRWCTTMVGESFIAWIHTKALRLFVESVLRYGLPVNFVAVVIEPSKSGLKKLRSILASTYAHLDSAGGGDDGDISVMISGAPRTSLSYRYFHCHGTIYRYVADMI